METIKQVDGSSNCVSCVASMITNCTVIDFEKFWKHSGPYSMYELNTWLVLHGFQVGVGIRWNPKDVFDQRTMKLSIEIDLDEFPCVICVKSMTGRPEGHLIYWDGTEVRDPNPRIDYLALREYEIEEIFPVLKIEGIDGPVFDLETMKQVRTCNDAQTVTCTIDTFADDEGLLK